MTIGIYNPQMKWFEQPSLRPTKSDDFISSDSESNLTLEELLDPLQNLMTVVEVEQDLFFDVNTSTEDEEESSYTEDDESLKGMSSVMSLSETSALSMSFWTGLSADRCIYFYGLPLCSCLIA
jgi:hypothetical protein